MTQNTTRLALVVFLTSAAAFPGTSIAKSTEAPAARPPATAPADAVGSLPAALEDWIALLDRDDAATAVTKWSADEAAAGELKSHWAALRAAHAKHDYRRWVRGADGIAAAVALGAVTSFKVGGHDHAHMHVEWVKGDAGWRVAKVWMCR